MTLSEKRGLRKILKRIERGEIVVIQKDKSGKLAVISRDMYSRMGEDHIMKDPVVDWEDIRQSQRTILGHLKCLNSIFNPGLLSDTVETVKAAKLYKSSVIPFFRWGLEVTPSVWSQPEYEW